MPLRLVLSDFYWDAAAVTDGTGLAPMPALSQLLRLGDPRSVLSDWRTSLLSGLSVEQWGDLAPALIAARALPTVDTRGHWFAAPVHQTAGISRVRLHAAGLLRLAADEAQLLCESFAREFASTDLHLHAVGCGLLLEGLDVQRCAAEDPARYLGQVLEGLTDSALPKALRRLSTELEMWMHGHPVNQMRQRRNELPVTGLWLWGGDSVPLPMVDIPSKNLLPIAYGDDPYLLGLWKMLGGELRPPAQAWSANHDNAVVVVSAAAQSATDAPMQRLESAWFAPILEAIEQGKVDTLSLHLGGSCWQLRRPLVPRFWRRSKPWWQRLPA
jgi:hypothetical protein